MSHGSHDDEAPDEEAPRPLTEFDCPTCNANNPSDELRDKDEVTCGHCGASFEVRISREGKMKLKDA